MKSIIVSGLLSIVFFISQINGQVPAPKNYFQQEVNYKINVSLNDQNHTLKGDIEIQYKNNAPVALDTILMHLWPNAYSSKYTAFAQQQIRNGSSKFYFSKKEDSGNITQLDFKVDNHKVKWRILNKISPDIAYIVLNKPLLPNQSIVIQTPFTVKIPASFSRMGHVNTAYQITQWYPKPAVFDQKGWHPMPYLDLGEFYSEFGNYDVNITLPQNYVVGATGQLQTGSELDFLSQKIEETSHLLDTTDLSDEFPASAKNTKTIQYKARNVHDFAWFADKRFLVTADTLQLPSGKIIETFAMFPPSGIKNWMNATDYIKRAVNSYSTWVGEYPYPHATAVQSALSAGGGMEYPMITVIGDTHSKKGTDDVITHEVGHNWFYGILASNERDYAWMDEGMNTFYENRYMKKFYPPTEKNKYNIEQLKLLYLVYSRLHIAAAPNDPVAAMSEMNYGLTAYGKPAISLKMLETFVGRPTFDRIMKTYYNTWKFKHPYPEDFKKIWIENTDKNLDWFFDDVINTTKTMDYKVLKIKEKYDNTEVTILNKGQLKGPVLLYAYQDDIAVDSLITDGFIGQKKFTFSSPKVGSKYDYFKLDPLAETLDLNPKNNNSYRIPVKLKLGFALENSQQKYLFALPIVGWNEYDKSMLGVALYNEGILQQNFYYSFMPMYSFGAKTLVGQAEIQYPIYTNGIFRKITPRISAKRFSFYQNPRDNYSQTYTRIAPKVILELPNKKNKQTIILQHELVQTDQPVYDNQGSYKQLDKLLNQYSQINYHLTNDNAIHHHHIVTGLEYAQYDNFDIGKKQYIKLTGMAHSAFTYQTRKRIFIGIQGGYFLQNDARYSNSFNNGLVLGSLSTSGTGRDDYAYRQTYFGRSENSGILGQEISSGNAGVKHPVLNGSYGHSNDWMLGINLAADLPIKLPKFMELAPYFDVAFFGAPKTNQSTQMKKMYSAGVQLKLTPILKINFPFFNNKELNTLLKQRENGSYLGRMTFQLAMNKVISPRKGQELVLKNL